MYVLSFDVGIKNLAYCILDGNTGKIVEWELINIIQDDIECYKEGCHKKSTIIVNKEDKKYFCGLHCRGVSKDCKKKIKLPNQKNVVQQTLIKNLLSKLQSHMNIFTKYNPDKILIELQLRVNPKMKFISHSIYNFFMIRFNLDSSLKPPKIRFCSAKYKLRNFYKSKTRTSSNKSDNKNQRKVDSVFCCKEMLRKEEQITFLDVLNKSNKKDDLADCFLQARYFID